MATTTKRPSKVPCPYCLGTRTGRYWTESLNDTIETRCHLCNKRGNVTVDAASSALEWDLDSEGRMKAEYFDAFPDLKPVFGIEDA